MADDRCPHGFSGSIVYCPNEGCPSHEPYPTLEVICNKIGIRDFEDQEAIHPPGAT